MHEHVYKLVVASLSNNFAFVLTKAKRYMCGPFSHLSKFPKRFYFIFTAQFQCQTKVVLEPRR